MTMRFSIESLKRIKEAIIKNKSFLIVFIIGASFVIYSGLILFDLQGPTSEYDNKPIGIHGTLKDGLDQFAGDYNIQAEYRSKGVISSNKDIEFFVYSVEYNLQKEQNKGLVGMRNIWPDNFTMTFCPDDLRYNGDSLYSINPCINGIVLLKGHEDNLSVTYNMGRNMVYYKYDIEFVSSGQKTLTISSILSQIHKENVFEIEPYNTYLQIQLQKYMYILALLGFVIILFQFYEFAIKHFKK